MAPGQSRQLSAFMHVSLDGYFCDPRGDMSFAHKPLDDAEWQEFVADNAVPDVAAQMNAVSKIVFRQPLNLTLTHARTFGNGSAALCYAPVR